MKRVLLIASTLLIGASCAPVASTVEPKCVASRDSRLINVKKGDVVNCKIWAWNIQQNDTACTAEEDMPELGARKGDHVTCERNSGQPPTIPTGYCIVYYTSGCPTCPVGWVYARGERCENCLNCMT